MDKKKVRRNDNVVFEIIEGEGGVLYNSQTKETHLLNKTAIIIFELCCETAIEDVFHKFYCLFNEESKERISKDFYEAIKLLEDKKIIELY